MDAGTLGTDKSNRVSIGPVEIEKTGSSGVEQHIFLPEMVVSTMITYQPLTLYFYRLWLLVFHLFEIKNGSCPDLHQPAGVYPAGLFCAYRQATG